MSDSTPKVYLVAGATRGIGLALVAAIASKDPSAIIYPGTRDPFDAGASPLREVSARYPRRVEIVKYIAGDKECNDAIATEIEVKYGRVDTIIANAGIANYMGKVHETPANNFLEHFSVNVLGPTVLFQSFRDLLKASSLPRFITISSGAGSMELIEPGGNMDVAAYGTSKAALNWITRKIHYENEWLVTFPQCPGAVDTDMSNHVLSSVKDENLTERLRRVMRPPNVAASLLTDIFTASTRENDGGQYHTIDGGRYPW